MGQSLDELDDPLEAFVAFMAFITVDVRLEALAAFGEGFDEVVAVAARLAALMAFAEGGFNDSFLLFAIFFVRTFLQSEAAAET